MKQRQALLAAFSSLWAACAFAQSSPPTITNPPAASLTNSAGSTVTFTVGVGGTAPFDYRWRKNGSSLPGASNLSLVLSNVLAADQGSYTVVITNGFGSVTSAVAKLTVIDPVIITQPTWEPSEPVIEGDVSFVQISVEAIGTDPLSYQWRRNGTKLPADGAWGYGTTEAMLTLFDPATGDNGTYSVIVSNALGKAVTSSNAVLKVYILPSITNQPLSKDVILGANHTFSVKATGSNPLTYQWLFNGNPISGATNTSYTLTNVREDNAGDYGVRVTNPVGEIDSDPATLNVIIPPTITVQPQGGTFLVGEYGVAFDVWAEGTDPMTYQWRKNGTAIAGATDWFYEIVHNPGTDDEDYNVRASDAGSYSVVVRNDAGTAVSSNVVLVVIIPPVIQVEPQDQNVKVGTNVTFKVSATGTAPLSYQWFFNADPDGFGDVFAIVGATRSNLTFSVTNISQAGAYSCQVSNVACSDEFGADPAYSRDAILTVRGETNKPTISITSPTSGQRVSNAVFTVKGTASDNVQVAEVWYQLNGATWSPAWSGNGWTNWSAMVGLIEGTNLCKAYAVDSSGNKSPTNSVSFVASNAFQMRLSFSSAPPLTSNGLELRLDVSPGLNGRIEVSTNLADWTSLTNWTSLANFTGTNSILLFRDTAATNLPRRFYRAESSGP